jgi:hypothetical protein
MTWVWWHVQPGIIVGRDPLPFRVQVRGVGITLPGLRLIFGVIILSWVLAFLRSANALRAYVIPRREFAPGRILSTIGTIIWHGGNPRALIGGRLLPPWDARAIVPVAPGRYRFYFLPRTGWLLSVQRLRDGERPTADDEAVTARWGIAAANGLDPTALPDNRAGFLTAGQARDVARRERAGRPGALLFGAIWLAIGLWFAFSLWHLVWHGGIAAARTAGSDVFWQVAAAILFAAVGGYTLFRGLGGSGYRLDLKERRVAMREGSVTAQQGSGDDSRNVSYCYRIADEEFSVSRAGYNALAEGFVYRLYFTPRSKHLVNIEYIEQPAAPAERVPDWFR